MSSEKLKMNSKKRDNFVRYSEGATMYHIIDRCVRDLFFGIVRVVPFDNQISKDTEIYKLVNTNIYEKFEEAKK